MKTQLTSPFDRGTGLYFSIGCLNTSAILTAAFFFSLLPQENSGHHTACLDGLLCVRQTYATSRSVELHQSGIPNRSRRTSMPLCENYSLQSCDLDSGQSEGAKSHSEASLLLAAKRGYPAAFGELYKRHVSAHIAGASMNEYSLPSSYTGVVEEHLPSRRPPQLELKLPV